METTPSLWGFSKRRLWELQNREKLSWLEQELPYRKRDVQVSKFWITTTVLALLYAILWESDPDTMVSGTQIAGATGVLTALYTLWAFKVAKTKHQQLLDIINRRKAQTS